MENPLVSVIVLNWNGERCIEQCLRSLLSQNYPNYEVIVVDNASSDGSPDIIRRKFPKVRLIVNDRNLGFAEGNNVGIKAARGYLIALFNYDAMADQNWLSELVGVIMKSKCIGIVGGPIYYFEPRDVVWAAGGKMDMLTGLDWHPYQGEKLEESYCRNTNNIDFIPGCALLIKRDVVEKIGLLDKEFFLYYDDLDWCVRAKRAGYVCRFAPSGIVYHMVSFSWRRKPLVGYFHFMKSKFYFCLKHFPPPLIVTSIFFQMVFTFFEILWFGRPVAYARIKLRALTWNLDNLKSVIDKRKDIKKIGSSCCKIRLLDLLRVVKKRIVTREYYW